MFSLLWSWPTLWGLLITWIFNKNVYTTSTSEEVGAGSAPFWGSALGEGKEDLGCHFINSLPENLWCAVCRHSLVGYVKDTQVGGSAATLQTHYNIKIFLSKAQKSLSFSYRSSYFFYGIYLFWYFHRNCGYQITPKLENFLNCIRFAEGKSNDNNVINQIKPLY